MDQTTQNALNAITSKLNRLEDLCTAILAILEQERLKQS